MKKNVFTKTAIIDEGISNLSSMVIAVIGARANAGMCTAPLVKKLVEVTESV